MSGHRIKEAFEKAPQYKGAIKLIELLNDGGFEAYIAGGAVRDALLGLGIHDFDVASSATPDEMKKVFRDYKILEHGVEFGTLTVIVDKEPYEITTYRGESGYEDSRHPGKVEFIRSKDEDLKRRDFTINAMFYHPKEGLYDPFGGEKDLDKKLIRTVGDSKDRFNEDALRILRMMRFSVTLGFDIEKECLIASKTLLPKLTKLSKERVFSELDKVFSKKISFEHFEKLQMYYFGKTLDTVELSNPLEEMEKSYLYSKLNKVVPNFSNYILPKALRKDFEFFLKLKHLKGLELKKKFIKKIETDGVTSKEMKVFFEMFVDCLKNDKEKESFKKGFDMSKLKESPFLSLKQEIQKVLKSPIRGVKLGEALVNLKVNYLWKS